MMNANTIIVIFSSVALVGVLLIAVIVLTRKHSSQLDVDKYRLKWLAIEKQLSAADTSSCQLAILNADKLLDQALKERGTKGETMGERMKTAKASWTNADNAWNAHKLRNRIAHETDVQIPYAEARRALAGFKQALKDMGAI